MKEPMQRITLPAGTIVHICGIPFYATRDTEVESHPNNVAMLSQPQQEAPVAQWLENMRRPWWRKLLSRLGY